LRILYLDNNRITNISALAVLTNIGEHMGGWRSIRNRIKIHLGLANNQIVDISPLVNNSGIGQGDAIDLKGNPLNDEAYNIHIPALWERGVQVLY